MNKKESNTNEQHYDNPWIFDSNIFNSTDIGSSYGFVYVITNERTGQKYIGRKYFVQKRKPRGGGRRRTSESDWKNYYGSCPDLKRDIKEYGKQCFSRRILSLHPTVGKTNYEETRQLFANNVLTEKLEDGTPAYYNSNILGRYYKKDYYDSETVT